MLPLALDRLSRLLGVASGRRFVLVRVADGGSVGRILRLAQASDPSAALTHTPRALYARPRGGTSVHWLRAGDLPTLNLGRELLRELDARVVFVATPEVAAALVTHAADLHAWIADRIDATDVPAPFGVAGVVAARALPGPVRISWWGGPLEPALRAAVPEWEVHHQDADAPWEALREAAARPGWRVWTNVRFAWHESRIRWAEAEAGAVGGAVLDRPALDLPGWWRVHGAPVELDPLLSGEPDALEEALDADLEPEALGRPTPGLAEAPWEAPIDLERLWGEWAGLGWPEGSEITPDAPEWTDDAWLAAARPVGPELRALDPARVTEARAREARAVAATLAGRGWPWGARLGAWARHEDGGADEGLADALRRLWGWQGSFAVERALRVDRAGALLDARVDAVSEDAHGDVGRSWLASAPADSDATRGWRRLREARTRELGPWEEDVEALGALRSAEDPRLRREATLALAALLDDLGRPHEALPLLAEARAADALDPAPWRSRWIDRRLQRRFVPGDELLGPLLRDLAEARAAGDVVAGARVGLALGGQHVDAGRRARGTSGSGAAARALASVLAERMLTVDGLVALEGRGRPLEEERRFLLRSPGATREIRSYLALRARSSVEGRPPDATQRAAFWAAANLAEEALLDGRVGAAGPDLERAERIAADAEDPHQRATVWRMRVRALDDRPAKELAAALRSALDAPHLVSAVRPSFLVMASAMAHRGAEVPTTGLLADAVARLDGVTDPGVWSTVALVAIPPLLARRDARALKLLDGALVRAVRFQERDAATALPQLLTAAERWLAELRRDLHRARSTRSAEVPRIDRLVRRLGALLDAARDPAPDVLGADARAGLAAPGVGSILEVGW